MDNLQQTDITSVKVDPQGTQTEGGGECEAAPSRRDRLSLDVSAADWDILLASTALKIMFYPSYRSTDFEVHRNWLAITYTLPISKWYYDTTSEWTLDYPPFFAYFEKLLSIPASFIDPKIVQLNNLNYNSWSVVAYQRSTVILTELVLGLALIRFIRGSVDPSTQRIISASIFLHPGFFIVDHIHFQYNGFMFGILLWSILMARNGNKLASGILFAILLNFKHIYMYLAPAYFIYLLRSFCLSLTYEIQTKNFVSLANAVIAVFVASFGPFILMGQIPQVLSRLFPFTRGLNHAYWAPTFWALLTAMDRILLKYIKYTRVNIQLNTEGIASTSRGLVGDTVFAVIPDIKPIHTFIATIACQSIWLIKLWRSPTYKSFITALTLCGWTSFLFGWHVHEKAVLLFLIPLSLLAAERQAYFRTFMIASIAGVFSLFPLIFTPAESIVKVVYSVLWMLLVYLPLSRRVYEFPRSLSYVILDVMEKIYLAGFPLLLLFVSLFPAISQSRNQIIPEVEPCISSDEACLGMNHSHQIGSIGIGMLEFLPLMATSVYCAIGVLWSFLRLGYIYLNEETTYQGQLSNIG
ncbi:glucosyltransferase [Cyathus striatus]|nr:glucosyltransferase [Cyathus striatus]